MKKLLLLILACGSPALAAINVTEGSGKTVRTVTSGAQEVQVVSVGDGISTATITSGSLNTAVTNLPNTYTTTPGTGTTAVSGSVAQTNVPGTYTVTPGTGTFSTNATILNAPNTYTVTPGSGTFGTNATVLNAPNTYTITAGTGSFPITGNVGQVGTYAVVPASGIFSVNPASTFNTVSTNTVITVAVQLASGTATSPLNVVMPVAVQLASGTSTNPLNVTGSFSVVAVSTGANGQLPIPGISNMAGVLGPNGGVQTMRVDLSSNVYVAAGGSIPIISTNTLTVMTTTTVNVNVVSGGGTGGTASNFGQTFPGAGTAMGFNSINNGMQGGRVDISSNIYTIIPQAVFLASGTQTTPFYFNPASTLNTASTNTIVLQAVQLASGTVTNPFQINVLNVSTITHNGVPQPIYSTMTVPAGVLVSSTSFLSPFTQGTTVPIMADSQGRTVVADIPWEIQVTTYNAALGGDTVEHVLISSATGSQRIRMCGCMLMNASATNTGYTVYASTSNNIAKAVVGARAFPIGSPANYIPSGVRADCGRPFFVGDQGGQITYKASATQTAAISCTYYSQ